MTDFIDRRTRLWAAFSAFFLEDLLAPIDHVK